MQTVSEAQQNLASLLEQSQLLGGLRIQRQNGQVFILIPESSKPSPLDVPGVDGGITVAEIFEFIHAGRKIS